MPFIATPLGEDFYIRLPGEIPNERLPTLSPPGLMKPSDTWRFGGIRSFGSPGTGGALGFADPDTGVGYGYVTSRMGTVFYRRSARSRSGTRSTRRSAPVRGCRRRRNESRHEVR